MDEQLSKKLAEAISKTTRWWSEKSFKIAMNQDNGDQTTKSGEMVFMLQNMVAAKAQEAVTDEKILEFERELACLLLKELLAGKRARLDVDYAPCDLLYQACKKAGIDTHCLPCKTNSYIDIETGKAYGKFQYGGQTKEIQ